jgi:hypothetical protein
VIHSVDYKTNRAPSNRASLLGDVQLRSYHWLIMMCAEELWGMRPARVVTHLDEVKFNDIDVAYSAADIDDWHSWAVAMARKILRDEEHEAILNPYCPSCPIRETCPAFLGMPTLAAELDGVIKSPAGLQDPVKKLEWRDRANAMRLILEKSVKAIDAEFKGLAEAQGILQVAGQEWKKAADYKDVLDVRRLADLLGDQFWEIAGASKTSVEALTKGWDPSKKAQVMACFRRELVGTKIVRKDIEQAR